jgi:hypothetical protein
VGTVPEVEGEGGEKLKIMEVAEGNRGMGVIGGQEEISGCTRGGRTSICIEGKSSASSEN